MRSLLEHPLISPSEKKGLVARVFPNLSEETRNLLNLLIDRRRIPVLLEVIEGVSERYNQARGKVMAEVTTAVSIDHELEEQIRQGLSRMYEKEVSMAVKVDPEVLGGVRVRIGDRIIDDTLRGRLEALKRHLDGGLRD
jgi:F-type H+-transporting ATPase subunit delta